jgi:DNA-binding NarL/FixJ family response regulator
LILEDLHWADEATLDFLRFLVRQMPPKLVVLLTYRSEESGKPAALRALLARPPADITVQRLHLQPLDRDQVRTMVGEILSSHDLTSEFTDFLHERTLGLPLAVEELVRLLQDRRDLIPKDGGWARRHLEQLHVPDAIRDSILERVERLPFEARRMAQAAAVLAEPQTVEALGTTAGIPKRAWAPSLTEAIVSSVLVEQEGKAAFRHPLSREAVHDAITGPEKRRMHLAAAQMIEAGSEPSHARLAHHYRHAGEFEEWVAHAEAAADIAASHGEESSAADLLDDVVGVEPLALEHRARLATKLGEAALHSRRHVEAIERLEPLVTADELNGAVRGELRFVLGRLLVHAGRSDEGLAHIRAAVEDLSDAPDVAARAMVYLSYPWFPQGHLKDHLRWIERAGETAARATDPLVALVVQVDRAGLLACVGDPRAIDAAADLATDSEDPRERRELVRAKLNLASSFGYLGHYERARRLIESGQTLAGRFGYQRSLSGLEATSLVIRWFTGAWDGLEEDARRLLETAGDVPGDAVHGRVVLGLLAIVRRRVRVTEAALEDAVGFLQEDGEVPLLALASAALAGVYLAEGRADTAWEVVDRPIQAAEAKGIWVWAAEALPVAVESMLANGRDEDATDVVRRYAAGIRGRDAPIARAMLAVARGVLSRRAGEGAERHFMKAASQLQSMGRPYDAARALARAAVGAEAITRLETARGRFDALGATWDGDRVRARLRKLGVSQPFRGGRRGYGTDLSPREIEVARLVTRGRSNREIAEELFVSVKAVEQHVSSILRKAGVRSRRDVSEALGLNGSAVLTESQGKD